MLTTSSRWGIKIMYIGSVSDSKIQTVAFVIHENIGVETNVADLRRIQAELYQFG